MSEVLEFHEEFMQEIYAVADANSDFIEAEFVQYMANYLIEAGEIDEFNHSHYRAAPGIGMRVDGYSFNDEEFLLNLFVSDFTNTLEPASLTNTKIKQITKSVEKFLTHSITSEFHQKLEETSPGYGLARDIYTRRRKFSKVRVYILSNGVISTRVKNVEQKEIAGYLLTHNIWDVSRVHRLASAKKIREDIVIDFDDLFGRRLPCLPAHISTDTYKSYLSVVPGDVIAKLYDLYGARLLEQNVRCFLHARSNVNKGIRKNIQTEPEMFFAYNNGITATAENVVLNEAGTEIRSLVNFQIVNGGQTSASIYSALKKDKEDLSKIFVQMKLSIVDPEQTLEVVPKISEYANSQNRVNAADFFANHPYHVRLEEFSRRLWAPAVDGGLMETKWFYERARGQYLDAQTYLTPSEKKKYQIQHPRSQMFTKTDIAKFENVWVPVPDVVSKGAQKNFAHFAQRIGKEWETDSTKFNERYFQHMVARAIIFRGTEKLVSAQPWYNGGYRANIVAYAIAYLSRLISEQEKCLDFSKIFTQQKMTDALYAQLEVIAESVHEALIDTPPGVSNVTEWAKKAGCWDKVVQLKVVLSDELRSELVDKGEDRTEKKQAQKLQILDDGIAAQKAVMEIPATKWSDILEWGKANKQRLAPAEVKAFEAAVRIPTWVPTEKQSVKLLEVLERFKADRFNFKA